jgi:beta-glucanase (GH16 family)
MCLNVGPRPLMKNIRQGLIDPDTPDSAMTKKTADGSTWNLVYSDEFNTDGRTFFHGDDPYLEAVDLWYGVTMDLEVRDPMSKIIYGFS